MTDGGMSFGEWLRRRRKSLDLTQKDLAERAGYSEITIRKIEADEYRPSKQGAELLASSLEIPPEQRPVFVQYARAEWRATAAALSALAELPPLPEVHGAVPSTSQVPAAASIEANPGTDVVTSGWSLAMQGGSLIGRERDVAALREMLLHSEHGLFTLVGPPGIGKTRLGEEVASGLTGQFKDGVFIVPLVALRDADLVVPTIARAFNVKAGNHSVARALLDWLGDKELLLVLDNFEHVMPARQYLLEVLTRCPRVKLLVTSREGLHLKGEQYYSVPPLSVPDRAHAAQPEELKRYAAVQLFVARARQVHTDFDVSSDNAQAVANICARLDGLPLAIELVAARTRLLSPRTIMARLDVSRLKLVAGGPRDITSRHESLRGAIAWSYDLLDEDERRLFARISVFVGGCTLSAVEAVCNARGDLNVEVMDTVASLLDKSLLKLQDGVSGPANSEEPRFAMLETIREYAWERLVEMGEAERVRELHADYYLALAEAAEPQLMGSEQEIWLLQLEWDMSNVRAALSRALESKDVETAERLGGALWRFWDVRGYLSEGREWLRRILLLLQDTVNSSSQAGARANLYKIAGRLSFVQGDYAEAASLYRQGLAIYRSLDDQRGIASSLSGLGNVVSFRGDDTEARALYEEALSIFETINDKWGNANTLNSLGLVVQRQGDNERARGFLEAALILRREIGDKRGIAFTLHNLARQAHYQGDFARAHLLYAESLALLRVLEDKRGIASSLNNLGDLLRLEGDYDQAKRLITESVTLFRQLEDRRGTAVALSDLASVIRDRGDYVQAHWLFNEVLALIGDVGGKYEISRALAGLAALLTQSDPERATRLFASADTLRQATGTPLPPTYGSELERQLAMAKDKLDPLTFERAWQEGLSMEVTEALNYAAATGHDPTPPAH